MIIEPILREPGSVSFSWMEIQRTKASLVQQIDQQTNFTANETLLEFGLYPKDGDCEHKCPELDACIASNLWCDGKLWSTQKSLPVFEFSFPLSRLSKLSIRLWRIVEWVRRDKETAGTSRGFVRSFRVFGGGNRSLPYLLHGRHRSSTKRPTRAKISCTNDHDEWNLHAAKDQRRHFEEGFTLLQPRPRLLTSTSTGGVCGLRTCRPWDYGVTAAGTRALRIFLLHKWDYWLR